MTEDSLSCIGCELFSTFERHHLQESHRSKNDPKHSELVKKLSSGTPITMEDLKQCKSLSKEDIATNPKDWKYAPMMVSTNLERMNICRQKAMMFAKEHSTHVFKWKVRTQKWENRPEADHLARVMEENAFFWQHWVPGAEGYLTYNVNPALALVNGAPVTTHSLTF